jgi:cellulose synthase/poly-beta-1,6-N-acetylglucosamine synthase-like glycosyltransferase
MLRISVQPLPHEQHGALAALVAQGPIGNGPARPAPSKTRPPRFVPDALDRPVDPGRDRGDYSPRVDRKLPLRQRLIYILLLLAGLFLVVRFGFFWFSLSRLPRDFGRRLDVGDFVLFAALTGVVWHRQLVDMCSWLICTRVEAYRPAPPPAAGLRVAFITTFVPGSESIEMLRRTLISILAANYPHDTWLLDEGDNPQARELCARLGVSHFSRQGIEAFNRDKGIFLARSKGGNHNAWYVSVGRDYDVVAQVDSDFLVRRDFLTRTLGHFRNPRIAFVGTPQIYGNVDNLIARGAGHQTFLFYGPILRALSRRKMALLIGANHIIRVAALRQIGWYQGHLTEDLATGKRFHAKRWQSVYVPLPLAIGEGPTTWADYFNQQYRWASGCMHIFFSQSPWLNAKMRRAHAFYYFLLEQFYFSGVSLVVAVVLLMLYYAFGWKAANLQIAQLAVWYAPLVIWRQLVILWLQRFNVRPAQERGMLWAGRLVTIAAIPIYFLAFIGVLRKKRVTFKTTPKGGNQSQNLDRFSVFAPHMVIVTLLVSGMGLAILLGHTVWVFLAWGAATSALFSGLVVQLACRRMAAAVRRWRRSAPWQGRRSAAPPWEVHHQPATPPWELHHQLAAALEEDGRPAAIGSGPAAAPRGVHYVA